MNESEIRAAFATAIRSCRNQLGISQETLAERANLHRTYISDIERGARNLSLESISKLAEALKVSIPSLFSVLSFQGKPGQNGSALSDNDFVDILLVEDDANDVELTLQAFKDARFANQVHVVRDGAEALDYMFYRGAYENRSKKESPQIILLDLYLPKVDGIEVLRRLKMDKRTRTVPVAVLTASQKAQDFEECRRLGAEACIAKPVDFQRLTSVTPLLQLNWALLKPTAAGAVFSA